MTIQSPLKVIDPIDLSGLTNTTIAEPDTSVGEAEWVDPSVLVEGDTLSSGTFSSGATANYLHYDGKVYVANNDSQVLIYDTSDNTYETIQLTNNGVPYHAAAINGMVYFPLGTNNGDLLVIDPSDNSYTEYECTSTDFSGTFVSAFTLDGETVYLSDTEGALFTFSSGSFSYLNYRLYDNTAETVTDAQMSPSGDVLFVSTNYLWSYSIGDGTLTTIVDNSSSSASYGAMRRSQRYNSECYIMALNGIVKLDSTNSASTLFLFSDLGISYSGSTSRYDFTVKNGKITLACYSYDDLSYVAVIYDIDSESVSQTISYGGGKYLVYAGMNDDYSIFAIKQNLSTFDSTIYTAHRPYITGEEAILTSTHLNYYCADDYVYESPLDGATGEDGATWVEIGPTNRWAPFDYKINTKTYQTSEFYFDLTLDRDVTCVAIFGLENIYQARCSLFDSSWNLIQQNNVDLEDLTPIDTGDLDYNDAIYRSEYIWDNIPAGYSGGYIRVWLWPVSGKTGAVGAICMGNPRTIGDILYDTSINRVSYSTIEQDTFGNLSRTIRDSADYITYEVDVPTENVPYVAAVLKSVLDQDVVWYGQLPSGYKLVTLGYYETSPLSIPNYSRSDIELKINGIV